MTNIDTSAPALKEKELDECLKALAHPSRLEIIRQLAKRDRCCGNDFCDCLSLAQSTISQHLDMLKISGLVIWQQQGTKSIYTLNQEKLAQVADSLNQFSKLDCCTNNHAADKPSG